jgi:hypothetical protein
MYNKYAASCKEHSDISARKTLATQRVRADETRQDNPERRTDEFLLEFLSFDGTPIFCGEK